MNATAILAGYLKKFPVPVGKVVEFNDANDCLFRMDLTANNAELDTALLQDPHAFSRWVNNKLEVNGCKYGIGGYMENRTIYQGLNLFENNDEPRTLHLGIDIWGPAGTAVHAPLNGQVHSFANNAGPGNYGPTLILKHHLQGLNLYSLYGHLAAYDFADLTVGQAVTVGLQIGSFGTADENGNWPPHLHFQLMLDIEGNKGDYPGVCKYSEKEKYLKNIPDPNLLLPFEPFAEKLSA